MTAAVDQDREWHLAACRGDIDTDAAVEHVRFCKLRSRDEWERVDPETSCALITGDLRYPDDPRRTPTPEDRPPVIDVDPETAEAFDRLDGHPFAELLSKHPDARTVCMECGEDYPLVDFPEHEQRHRVETSTENGEVILDDIAMFLGRFIAFPSPAAQTAVTLWVAHCHMVHCFESSPRLALLSPEPGSGKTRVLEVVELLVPTPQHMLNASVAAVFRMIGQSRPTLLLDEVDTIFAKSKGDDSAEDLRGLLNAGHRRTAVIPRCRPPKMDVEYFPVYAAVALAGLGDLPDTLMSRSVIVRMRRRAPTEQIDQFRRRLVEPEGYELRDRLAYWANQVSEYCGDAWPDMPPGVIDRPADVWEPLLAIADAAGGMWPKMARDACQTLVAASAAPDDVSIGVRLLADIRDVFADDAALATVTLIDRLTNLDEAPWGDWYGKPIDARWLARKLRPYGVSSSTIRFGDSTPRGYRAEDFHDTWARYLPETATSATPTTEQVTPTSTVAPVSDVALPGIERDNQERTDQ